MPHLVILYTPNLEADVDMTGFCRHMADTMLTVMDEQNKPVFPIGGVRVLAYPAAHFAVADGKRDYGFVYLNLRIGRGRSGAVHQHIGVTLEAAAKGYFAELLTKRFVGITFQVDEGPEVFDAKNSTIHPLFKKP